MKTELDDRQHTTQEKRIKIAGFPFLKTLDEFDTHRLEHISEGCIRKLVFCDFIGRWQNAVMVGNLGSDKTHLTIAIGRHLISDFLVALLLLKMQGSRHTGGLR